MKVLGIDPGIARTGWAVLTDEGGKQKLIDYGCLETFPQDKLDSRLLSLATRLRSLVRKHSPEFLAMEKLFFNTNAKTALTVGQARGVILLVSAECKLKVREYTPLEVKMSITGFGRADKNQIQQMVKNILHLTSIPKPDDAADALAIALTDCFSYKLRERVKDI